MTEKGAVVGFRPSIFLKCPGGVVCSFGVPNNAEIPMKLFFSPGACSQAVHIALRESGIPFDLEQVDLKEHKTKSGADYYAINPKGYVPALLLDDGQLLGEVQVLLQYVADKAPEAKLAPAYGTMERYRLQEWLAFISSEIHKSFGPLFYPTTPEETKKANRERIVKRFQLIDEQLAGKQFLMGAEFSVADAYLFVMLRWGRAMKIEAGSFANLEAYYGRVASRPAVHATLEAEGITKK